jgi:hypothetical protein
MASPVYRVVQQDRHWCINFDGLLIGEYATAEEAAEAALTVARSRLAPNPEIRIETAATGEITVGDPEESA